MEYDDRQPMLMGFNRSFTLQIRMQMWICFLPEEERSEHQVVPSGGVTDPFPTFLSEFQEKIQFEDFKSQGANVFDA
jgi:hypothetical protein